MDRYLPVGYELHLNSRVGKYIITDIIGRGASTVAYGADYYCDDGNSSKHIIKEFNPSYISFQRTENGEMQFNISDKSRVVNAKERFLSGCNNQIKIRNQIATMNQTPPVEGPFYDNDTIYMDVIAYNGTTYDVAYKNLSLRDRMKVCLSVSKLVKCYHDAGYLCLDVKPENIFVIPETKELLYFIDFDSICLKEEITFGNSISYTKQWAAPEQLNPYAMNEISEATDIYAIGELVFWSVFKRHSTTEEHRGFSVYPFENIRPQVSNILAKLFHNTLRPSVNSRFKSINHVIELLNDVVEELSKKEYIITSAIRPKEFFIGRENELAELDIRLKEEKIIFLYGIGGIGKSEIAKQYFNSHKSDYNNALYMTYENDLESMICNDVFVAVSGIAPFQNESESSYCNRKLRKIKELMFGNNLIVIDNLDIQVDEIHHSELWQQLMTLPCCFLITTRVSHPEFTQINVTAFDDINYLKGVFKNYCSYNDDDELYVEKIIDTIGKNTYAVELLAKSISAEHSTPKLMLERLEKYGISVLDTENVRVFKDGNEVNKPAKTHIEKLFSVTSISKGQRNLLLKLALMPVTGVTVKDFFTFFSLNNYNDLNWLVEHGWVFCDKHDVISIHSLTAESIIHQIKDDEICNLFNNDIFQTAENLERNLYNNDYNYLYNSIALKCQKYNLYNEKIAEYITKYVALSMPLGNIETKTSLLIYAIKIFDTIYPINDFIISRERAYDLYVALLLELDEDCYIEIEKICNVHYSLSRTNKNYLWATYWSMNLARSMVNKSFLSILRTMPSIVSNLFRDNSIELDIYVKSFFIRDAELFEAFVDSKEIKHKWIKKLLLKIPLLERKIAFHFKHENETTSLGKAINEQTKLRMAYVWFLSDEYEKAKKCLMEIIGKYDLEECHLNQYKAKKLFAEIAIEEKEYEQAVIHIEECIKIESGLHLPPDVKMLLQLKELYIHFGKDDKIAIIDDKLQCCGISIE